MINRIFKVCIYDASKTLLRVVLIHAEHFTDAGCVALKRHADDKPAFTSVRIR